MFVVENCLKFLMCDFGKNYLIGKNDKELLISYFVGIQKKRVDNSFVFKQNQLSYLFARKVIFFNKDNKMGYNRYLTSK